MGCQEAVNSEVVVLVDAKVLHKLWGGVMEIVVGNLWLGGSDWELWLFNVIYILY